MSFVGIVLPRIDQIANGLAKACLALQCPWGTSKHCGEQILAADGSPEVSQSEVDAWKAKISKIHLAAGHPTNRNLARVVKDEGHAEWKVKAALEHQCPCASLRPAGASSGQIPPAARTPMPVRKAWQAVTVDVGEWNIPGSKKKAKFAVCMDMAAIYELCNHS